MDLLGFLKPRIVFEKRSPFNTVTVVNLLGTYTLKSDGVTQSAFHTSDFAKHGYWRKAADIITTKVASPDQILFLGLGGGTSVHYLSKKYPKATLTAVEIDDVVIEAANTYFEIGAIPNLSIITANAFDYIKDVKGIKFDVIFADMFMGGFFVSIPNKHEFFTDIINLLTPNGLLIFNYTFKKDDSGGSKVFIEELKTVFSHVDYTVLKGAVETDNYLIYCQK
jgi:spermidine synthase